MVEDYTMEEPMALATQHHKLSKDQRGARRSTHFVQANQDSKTYAMILRQVIQNQRNYGA